jgi:hypothetical protein
MFASWLSPYFCANRASFYSIVQTEGTSNRQNRTFDNKKACQAVSSGNCFRLIHERITLMSLKIDFTPELTNTRFAPLAVLSAHYQAQNLLKPLQKVQIPMRNRYFEPADKLIQVLMSILTGCETLSEVTTNLKPERRLATVWGWDHFADQSSLSRTLDVLTQKQIDELRASSAQIWKPNSQVMVRDWRKYLWLDYDLSALPCGPQAEAALKGYFGEKKRLWTPISPCQRCPGARNRMVRRVSWQCPHPALLQASR